MGPLPCLAKSRMSSRLWGKGTEQIMVLPGTKLKSKFSLRFQFGSRAYIEIEFKMPSEDTHKAMGFVDLEIVRTLGNGEDLLD